ncbi:hypothetical protein, partial [Paraburkholderia youngii]|uniref:hypothetical protein n=1 Tax=Paraburkholderia youngii TaxID=2782701 RepID=UPI001C8425F2
PMIVRIARVKVGNRQAPPKARNPTRSGGVFAFTRPKSKARCSTEGKQYAWPDGVASHWRK